MNEAKGHWDAFLNPDVVRTRFAAMGVFMVAHELLLLKIRDRPLDLFSNEYTAEGGRRPGADYRREVLSLDPRGKGDALRGSVAFLRKMGVIDGADEEALREFTKARNTMAHELSKIILGGEKMPEFSRLFPQMIELVAKIDRWWIINVEIADDLDFDDEGKVRPGQIDEDGITPGSVTVMQILSSVALGEDEEAWAFYREFVERKGLA